MNFLVEKIDLIDGIFNISSGQQSNTAQHIILALNKIKSNKFENNINYKDSTANFNVDLSKIKKMVF